MRLMILNRLRKNPTARELFAEPNLNQTFTHTHTHTHTRTAMLPAHVHPSFVGWQYFAWQSCEEFQEEAM